MNNPRIQLYIEKLQRGEDLTPEELTDYRNIMSSIPKAPQDAQWEAPTALDTAGDAVRGAYQGITFGFGDELLGGLGGLANILGEGGFTEGYTQTRDGARSLDRKAQENSPTAFTVGEVAGAIGSGIATPQILAGKVAGAIGGLGGKALGMAVQGAAEGAVYSAGKSEEDVASLGFLEDMGEGALFGGLVGGAIPLIKPTVKLAGKAAKASGEFGLGLSGLDKAAATNVMDNLGNLKSSVKQMNRVATELIPKEADELAGNISSAESAVSASKFGESLGVQGMEPSEALLGKVKELKAEQEAQKLVTEGFEKIKVGDVSGLDDYIKAAESGVLKTEEGSLKGLKALNSLGKSDKERAVFGLLKVASVGMGGFINPLFLLGLAADPKMLASVADSAIGLSKKGIKKLKGTEVGGVIADVAKPIASPIKTLGDVGEDLGKGRPASKLKALQKQIDELNALRASKEEVSSKIRSQVVESGNVEDALQRQNIKLDDDILKAEGKVAKAEDVVSKAAIKAETPKVKATAALGREIGENIPPAAVKGMTKVAVTQPGEPDELEEWEPELEEWIPDMNATIPPPNDLGEPTTSSPEVKRSEPFKLEAKSDYVPYVPYQPPKYEKRDRYKEASEKLKKIRENAKAFGVKK